VPADYPTIQRGIDNAVDGDTVLVEDNLYVENISFRGKAIMVAGQFLIDRDSSHIENTIINGSMPLDPDSGSVVYFMSGEDTNSVLNGFTITGGTGTWHYNEHVKSTCVGGGIVVGWSGAKIVNNIITENHIVASGEWTAYGGGVGLYPTENYHLILRNNRISHNSVTGRAGAGGGLDCCNNGHTTIEGNRITDNYYEGDQNAGGGGLFTWSTDLFPDIKDTKFISNIIKDNEAYCVTYKWKAWGGGICLENCSPYLYNNILSENRANRAGQYPFQAGLKRLVLY